MRLENTILAIVGDRGGGKSMLASCLGGLDGYKQVFSNFEITYKDKPVIKYKDFDLYKKIDFDNLDKKLLIFDEGGINANARNFQAKINKLLSFFIFVSRKFNIDIIFITQDFETFDKNIRRQTNYMIEVQNHLPAYIEAEIWKMKRGEKEAFFGTYEIKTLEWLELKGIKYDTRDLSGFEEKLKEFLR